MQHTDENSAGTGPSDFIDVSSEDVLAIPSCLDVSTGEALTSGIILAFSVSGGSATDFESQVWQYAYKGTKRYVRLVVENKGSTAAGSTYIGAVAVLGRPANWPVTDHS